MLHISKLLYETRMSYQVSFLCSLQPQQKYILSPANYILVADYPPSPPCRNSPLAGQGLLSTEASPSHSETPHLVGLLRTSDQSDAQNSDNTHTHTHDRQTSMPSALFELAISTNERSQTHALDRAVTGIGWFQNTVS